MFTFWKYTLVETEDYNQLIEREGAAGQQIEELKAKVDLQRSTIMDLEGECKQERETSEGHLAVLHAEIANSREVIANLHAQVQTLDARLADSAMAAGASEAALEKTLREEFAETLAERDDELARSVQQATALGYDNEVLRRQIEQLETDMASLKRSEEQKWNEAVKAQAEVTRLQAELAKAKPAPKPPTKRGKRNG